MHLLRLGGNFPERGLMRTIQSILDPAVLMSPMSRSRGSSSIAGSVNSL